MGCACAANQFFHSPHTEWTPQAGIRKDGRINPDTNPGGNVSDVGRWKLGDIKSWGSPANGQEKLQPNFGAHVKICAFYVRFIFNKDLSNPICPGLFERI